MSPPSDEQTRRGNRSAYRDAPSHAPSRRAQAATTSYKNALHKIFDGGGLPAHLREQLGARPDDPKKEQARCLEQAVVEATSQAALDRAAGQLVASAHPSYAEPTLLRLLEASDPGVVMGALSQLQERVDKKSIKRGLALRGRLETLIVDGADDALVREAQAIIARLKRR